MSKINGFKTQRRKQQQLLRIGRINSLQEEACMYFGSLRPAELSMSIKFCFFRFDNQNGYIGGPAAWFNFYSRTFTSSKVVNFPHLSSPQRLKYNVQDKIQDPEKKAAAVTPYRTNQLITRRSM